MPWSPPPVLVDSLALELAEDELRQAAAKMTGSMSKHRAGCVLLRYADAEDVRDQIAVVAERLKKMRDGAQR